MKEASLIICAVLALLNLIGSILIEDKRTSEQWLTRTAIYSAAVFIITSN